MFQDEARFGRISRCRYCWAKSPLRPTVKAMLTHQSVYAYGAVSIPQGNFDSLVLPHVTSDCMAIFLAEIAKRYPDDNIVMVLDGAGWHKSKSMTIPDNIRLLGLPPYSPERNPVEHLWDELREKHFHNRAFDSLDALENQLVEALHPLENSDERVKSICNWEWIIKAISNANYNNSVLSRQCRAHSARYDPRLARFSLKAESSFRQRNGNRPDGCRFIGKISHGCTVDTIDTIGPRLRCALHRGDVALPD